jgi:2-dehydro-3-deoxygluconokinase
MQIMDKKAVFLGECMIELSGDISSLDKVSSNMQVNFGGDTYNSAVYFSRLANKEVSTFFSTALGKDTFSNKMIDRFKKEKIKCDYIRTDGKQPPGLYSIAINKSGERSFSYWRNGSPAKFIFKGLKGKKLAEQIKKSNIFYYSGISAAILNAKQKKELIEIGSSAHSSGFDFNFRSQLHSNKLENQELFKEINKNVDIHFISFDDARDLFGVSKPVEIFDLLGNKNLLLIRYKNSIFLKNGSNELKVINVPHGKVVDMTAAGDSFNGSFLALMHNNKFSIEENILKAHSVTREVIKYKGAIIDKKHMPMINT